MQWCTVVVKGETRQNEHIRMPQGLVSKFAGCEFPAFKFTGKFNAHLI
jgi:hypothetical protein